jgi:3-methyladenine DNA glycosylase AlkC
MKSSLSRVNAKQTTVPDTLKDMFSPTLVRELASDLERAWTDFPSQHFVRQACDGLQELELLDRAKHIATALVGQLPSDYPTALGVVMRSLGPELDSDELIGVGMAPFRYLPYTIFVAERGFAHFDLSLDAQRELTKRCSCEWSIRSFIAKDPERTLAAFRKWARDPNAHVRRLVSEGCRFRLPWAPRVAWLDEHPDRVIELLELLRDDPASMVCRSVANSLNDLGKVHSELFFRTCAAWLVEPVPATRRPLMEHALRSAVKRGEPDALRLLGFGERPSVELEDVRLQPKRVSIGGDLAISFSLRSTAREVQTLLVDLRVHLVKASGKARPKVFKLRRVSLGPGASAQLRGEVSFASMTTRRHFPGDHRLDVIVNGVTYHLANVEVRP